MSQVNATAASARESARSADGKFGSYNTGEAAGVELERVHEGASTDAWSRLERAAQWENEATTDRARLAVDVVTRSVATHFPGARAVTVENDGCGALSWTVHDKSGSTDLNDFDEEDGPSGVQAGELLDDMDRVASYLPMDRPFVMVEHARGFDPSTGRSPEGFVVDKHTGTVDKVTFDVGAAPQ